MTHRARTHRLIFALLLPVTSGWSQLPSLQHARQDAMCGHVGGGEQRGEQSGEQQVVVTGGWDVWDATTEVISSMDPQAGWGRGPKLPLPLRNAATVPFRVSFYRWLTTQVLL